MTTAIKIENLMQTDYPKAAKVELRNSGDKVVRNTALIYPSSSLTFNVWEKDVEIVVTEVPIKSQV